MPVVKRSDWKGTWMASERHLKEKEMKRITLETVGLWIGDLRPWKWIRNYYKISIFLQVLIEILCKDRFFLHFGSLFTSQSSSLSVGFRLEETGQRPTRPYGEDEEAWQRRLLPSKFCRCFLVHFSRRLVRASFVPHVHPQHTPSAAVRSGRSKRRKERWRTRSERREADGSLVTSFRRITRSFSSRPRSFASHARRNRTECDEGRE